MTNNNYIYYLAATSIDNSVMFILSSHAALSHLKCVKTMKSSGIVPNNIVPLLLLYFL